tara:strand:+ start:141 stop:749 length:609 start_codon:yes stop_codon:yes gene_type:complete
MSEIDRITELLLAEEFGSEVPESLMGRELPNTEPTLDPNSLEALFANRQAMDDMLMAMGMGPKDAGKKAINVGLQRFMLPVNEIARTGLTRAGKPAAEAVKRQETINQAYQTANPTPNLATLYQKALDQLQKAKELARDTIGMRNPTGQIRQSDAMEAAALREIERIRKLGNGKLPDLMPDKLTTEQIQQAMLDAGLGSLKT